MILAHLWFNASLLLPQGKPRCGQKDMFTKDDNGGCGFEKSRYPEIYEIYIYIYAPMSLALSAFSVKCGWVKKKQDCVNYCRIFAY